MKLLLNIHIYVRNLIRSSKILNFEDLIVLVLHTGWLLRLDWIECHNRTHIWFEFCCCVARDRCRLGTALDSFLPAPLVWLLNNFSFWILTALFQGQRAPPSHPLLYCCRDWWLGRKLEGEIKQRAWRACASYLQRDAVNAARWKMLESDVPTQVG